ncbi:complex I subunit 4 family protein [Dyadobacter sediminis]|uniref:NADH-quinone oxidoreductase subunit M n=1 Tax=Dyadobacter sediminis TaxID=1493691 RepID=A0A5R9K629_9BACT|nr:NADH-quinone oxidoreductase subunit M [Dyadobacter sediminis]TLU89094.1 NADH-quinone oxidoreductase subunit M [Dyadobacter sediminis]GGC02805.1 NADH-quinone oxidoreductase subunit M [Dyadobacter sediminis]
MLTLLLILLPVIAAVITLFSGERLAKTVALIGGLATLGLAVVTWLQFDPAAGTQFGFKYAWVSSGGISFAAGLDGISLVLVLLTTFLTPLIVLSAFKHDYKKPASFYALILFMEAALIGVFTATDAFLFYLFFEAALIPVYFLAAIWGGENRIKVTFKFFIYTIFGSLFMMVALVYLYYQTPGTHTSEITAFYQLQLSPQTQGFIFWAFFIAFAIKMPLFPFHTWQPDTYTESPTAATMLLSGIMLKMGVYGLIRFLLPIVPQGMESWGLMAMILSVIGIIYGSIIAIQQSDMKRLIAYSSFAHVGLMAAGVFSYSVNGLQGALIQMLAHGINVIGLFFIIDIIYSRTKTRFLDQLGGISQSTPHLSIYFMILLLGSVALPLTNGFVGEFLLLSSVFHYDGWLGAIAGLTIILGSVYMLRLFQKSMFGPRSKWVEGFQDLTASESAVLLPLVIMVFWIGIYPNTFLKLTEPAVSQLLQLVNN